MHFFLVNTKLPPQTQVLPFRQRYRITAIFRRSLTCGYEDKALSGYTASGVKRLIFITVGQRPAGQEHKQKVLPKRQDFSS
jgi:hypothetical protein